MISYFKQFVISLQNSWNMYNILPVQENTSVLSCKIIHIVSGFISLIFSIISNASLNWNFGSYISFKLIYEAFWLSTFGPKEFIYTQNICSKMTTSIRSAIAIIETTQKLSWQYGLWDYCLYGIQNFYD